MENNKNNEFINLFLNMYNNKNNNNITKILTFNFDEDISFKNKFIKNVEQSSELRKNINEMKELTKIKTFVNGMEEITNFTSALSENFFSYYIYKLNQKNSYKLREKIEILDCDIAKFNLNKQKDDFYIKVKGNDETRKLEFDIKSQLITKDCITINKKAHERFINNNSDFYLICLIDSDSNNFKDVKKIHYLILTKEYFKNNAVYKYNDVRNSEYYSICLKSFKNEIFD